MNFTFVPRHAAAPHQGDPSGFTVERLWKGPNGHPTELSHLLDRTYAYHSVRELRWYLAEKFGLPATSVEVRPA